MVCPPELVKHGEAQNSTKCKKCAIEDLCGKYDGSSGSTYNCDPMVDIYRAADYFNASIPKETSAHKETERYPVQWMMEGQKDPAYYYRLKSSWLIQYVYKVNDSDRTPSEHCATLVARVRDRDGRTGLLQKWGQMRFVKYEEIMPFWRTTKFPLPGANGVKLGRSFIYSKLYDTKTEVKIKVKYLVRFDEVFMTGHEGRNATTRRTFENVASDGLKVLKNDLNISPKGIMIGTHELVCYTNEKLFPLEKKSCPP